MPPEKVLIVDDEATIVRLCQRLLERGGFEVSGTTDPSMALEMVNQQPFDLLVVDIRMPAMDGFELATTCRSAQPDLAVLVMTGHGNLETAIQALRRGIDGLLLKPIEVDGDLVETARQVLQDRRRKQDATRLQILRPLFDISESLLSESSPEAVERKAIQELQAHLQADRIGIYYRLPSDYELHRLAAKGLPFPWELDTQVVDPMAWVDKEGSSLLVSRGGREDDRWVNWLSQTEWCSFMAVPVRRLNGAYMFFAARTKDVTPFGAADLELLTILARQAAVGIENASLYGELRSNMRRIEESQRALVHAEKMSALGRLLVTVAHEINNPLQSVRNCVHIARRDQVDDELRQDVLDMASTELDRLGKIVRRMLDFYRPEGLEKSTISFETIVNRVLELLEPQLRQSNIRVQTSFSRPTVTLQLLQDQIQQVILNLLINSLDALQNRSGGGQIWIAEDVRGDHLVLSIEDNGPGVQRGMEEMIFEPFFSTKPEGTGIGLSISYGLVKANEGVLSLGRPVHGNGARFEILLPLGGDHV